MNDNSIRKSRAMSSDKARNVRQAGHDAEDEFAELIGGRTDIRTRKKDVVDKNNGIHSVKSGELKWQIFLYGITRFMEDLHFTGANIFVKCLQSFPDDRQDYIKNKIKHKTLLQVAMRELKEFLSEGKNKRIFLEDSFLNISEIDYLTIKQDNIFHVFDGKEAMEVLDSATKLENSRARNSSQMNDLKVLFKTLDGRNIGELEVRNESDLHYRQVMFRMDKYLTFKILSESINPSKQIHERIVTYGKASRSFNL